MGGSIKCLACGEVNTAGNESCKACSSSLDLKLCGACEAMNHAKAVQCYRCGVAFDARPAAEVSRPEILIAEAPAVQLPEPYRPSTFTASPRRNARWASKRAIFTAVGVVALGWIAFLVVPMLRPASAGGGSALTAQPAPAVAGSINRAEGKLEAAVSVSAAPNAETAAQPKAKSGAAAETRAPEAAPVEAKASVRSTPAPQVASQADRASSPSRPAARASAARVEKAAPVVSGRSRVTHTRAAAAPTAALISAEPESPPSSASPSDCTEAIAALGLCSAVQKGKGN